MSNRNSAVSREKSSDHRKGAEKLLELFLVADIVTAGDVVDVRRLEHRLQKGVFLVGHLEG